MLTRARPSKGMAGMARFHAMVAETAQTLGVDPADSDEVEVQVDTDMPDPLNNPLYQPAYTKARSESPAPAANHGLQVIMLVKGALCG